MKAISVLGIENTDEELKAFPVEANIEVMLSHEVDLNTISDYVYLFLSNPGASNVGMITDILSANYQDAFTEVDCDYAIDQVASGWKLKINPVNTLIPGRKYALVISKDLPPKFWNITKTSSSGKSSIIFKPNKTESIDTDTLYQINIEKNSILSKGQNVIVYDLLQDGVIVTENKALNISKSGIGLTIGDVSLSPKIPFLKDESFEIAIEGFARLGQTITQYIDTFSQTTNYEGSQEKSDRLKQEDILKYYERVGVASKTKDALKQSVAAASSSKLTATYIYPNRIEIDLGIKIDPTSLGTDSFRIDIGYAFGNFMLEKLGYFNPNKRYVIDWILLDDQYIMLTINEDVDGIVPPNQFFIIRG